jgi:hypothetical protein
MGDMENPAKIRWSPRLRPQLLKRLYESDARGLQDTALCDKVGFILYARCHTFTLVYRTEVECPLCDTVFKVSQHGTSPCPGEDCAWWTNRETYGQSVRNHYAWPGRAIEAFESFYRAYPQVKTYPEKMLLIDHLIHGFHIDEKTGAQVKSVASKLLEGNKKAVVAFLDNLSARQPEGKEDWRRVVASTIDQRALGQNPFIKGG